MRLVRERLVDDLQHATRQVRLVCVCTMPTVLPYCDGIACAAPAGACMGGACMGGACMGGCGWWRGHRRGLPRCGLSRRRGPRPSPRQPQPPAGGRGRLGTDSTASRLLSQSGGAAGPHRRRVAGVSCDAFERRAEQTAPRPAILSGARRAYPAESTCRP